MSTQTDTLIQDLRKYDLSQEEAQVYLHLLKSFFSTALQISKEMHIGRTKVYRILDKLINLRLVEKKMSDRGLTFGAADPHRLTQIAERHELEALGLKHSAHTLIKQLEAIQKESPIQSKVLYYEGHRGLEQVTYNTVHAKDMLRVYEVSHMSDFLDEDYAEKIREMYVERKIHTHDLTNKSSFSGFTDVHELIKSLSKFRHIDPKILDIQFEVLIYNDVYATYTYTNGEIFCVEIYNEQLASMQKQIYDSVWGIATPMKFTDKRGAASL